MWWFTTTLDPNLRSMQIYVQSKTARYLWGSLRICLTNKSIKKIFLAFLTSPPQPPHLFSRSTFQVSKLASNFWWPDSQIKTQDILSVVCTFQRYNILVEIATAVCMRLNVRHATTIRHQQYTFFTCRYLFVYVFHKPMWALSIEKYAWYVGFGAEVQAGCCRKFIWWPIILGKVYREFWNSPGYMPHGNIFKSCHDSNSLCLEQAQMWNLDLPLFLQLHDDQHWVPLDS